MLFRSPTSPSELSAGILPEKSAANMIRRFFLIALLVFYPALIIFVFPKKSLALDVATPIVTTEEKTEEEEAVEEEVAKEEAVVEEVVGAPETQTEAVPFDGTSLSDTIVDAPDEPIAQTETTTSTTGSTSTTTTTTAEATLPSGTKEEVKVGSTTPVGDTQATVDLNPPSSTQEEVKVGAQTPVGDTNATVDLNPPSGTQEEVKVGVETPVGGTKATVDIGGNGSGPASQAGNTSGTTETGAGTGGSGGTGSSGSGSNSGTGSAGSNSSASSSTENRSLLGKVAGFFGVRQKESQKVTEGKSPNAASHAKKFEGFKGTPLSHKISKSENCQSDREGHTNCVEKGAK